MLLTLGNSGRLKGGHLFRVSCGLAENEGLIAEEQGGFHKQRGYRDQVLGANCDGKVVRGMLMAFTDFVKAYDKVDRGKLCMGVIGIVG